MPFAYCNKCKKSQQVVFIEDAVDEEESTCYDSYTINLYVDVRTGICSLLTSDGTYKFPLGKRYDGYALEQMLYAASHDFNTDYLTEDHVKNLVQQALSGIHHQMLAYGVHEINYPKKKKNRARAKPEKVAETA